MMQVCSMRALFSILFVGGLLLVGSEAIFGIGRKQRYKVKGEVFCPGSPSDANGIKVKLVDKDIGVDDNMGSTKTDSQGRFELEGEETETTDIDPELKVYHNCNDGLTPCARKWKIKLPKKYINKGVIDIGRLNLEMMLPDEEHDCIH